MNIDTPIRKPMCFNLDTTIKSSLNQLAKYHNTTLTNLLEQGARYVIQHNLKQIRNHKVESQHLESSINW